MSMFINKKIILPCTIMTALLLSGCGDKDQTQQRMALPVDISAVTTMDVPVTSRLSGRANPTRKAEVRPQVGGVIQKRLFVEGSIVKQGQQLYQIDPSVYEAQVASAEASLSSAKATLHSTQLKAERYASLLQKKAVSKQDYDDAEAAYLAAKAAVESAKASLRQANINLAYTKVYAPISGTISRSNITEGALVSAAQSTALTTIQQLDPIYVDLGQTVEDHMLLRKNMKEGKLKKNAEGKPTVDILFDNGDKYEYQGVLEFAEVTVDESTGMVNVRALVPNPDHLILPSMFLRGNINEGVAPDSLVVSTAGIQREPNGVTYVYVVDDKSMVQRINVKTGTEYQKNTVILSGLKVGDKVITSNIQKIRPGMPVMPIDPNAPKAQPDAAQNQQPAGK